MATLSELLPFIVMGFAAFGLHNAIHRIDEGESLLSLHLKCILF